MAADESVAVPGITDDNTFVDPGANPFVAPADDRLSTFGLDVDTGSFTVARTFLDQGLLPPPESIRTEEWVNAFGYGDAPPDAEAEDAAADLAVSVEGAPAPFAEDDTQLVRVGIKAREVAREDRPDAHITLVVDTSGSMDIRERLGLVRSTLALLALELRDTDTVAVVTYGDTSNVLLPATPASEAQRIVDVIDRLVPQGSTNMEAGLRAGYEQADDLRPRGHQHRGPGVGRGGQHRRHRHRPAQRAGARRGRRGHPPRHRRLRHGQLQRRPDGAAGRPGRRLLQLRRHLRGGRAPLHRRARPRR